MIAIIIIAVYAVSVFGTRWVDYNRSTSFEELTPVLWLIPIINTLLFFFFSIYILGGYLSDLHMKDHKSKFMKWFVGKGKFKN